MEVEGHEALRANLRWDHYAVNATMRRKRVCVGERKLAERIMRLLTVWRGSLEKVTHKQRLCVVEAKHRRYALNRLLHRDEMEIKSVVYI